MSTKSRHTGFFMNIEKLRKMVSGEVVDYQTLVSLLADYASPRDKISKWLKTGELIRLKKGLYIFSKEVALESYSIEVLANLIYGPSAISFSYALSYYGMIPERVAVVTSITDKKNKTYSTPVGKFTYRYINSEKYSIGIELDTSSERSTFLIASAEKALCDQLHLIDRKLKLVNVDEMEAYLLYDLRIDEDKLMTLRITTLRQIEKAYKDERIKLLIDYIKQRKKTDE